MSVDISRRVRGPPGELVDIIIASVVELATMRTDYEIVDPESVPTERFPESGIRHTKLTGKLGAEEMRVNTVTLEPGQVVGYHTHVEQEEIYVCVDGPGQVFVDGTLQEVPEGGVVRIGADVPRQVLNTGEEGIHRWAMFGAPTVGTREDFGEYEVASGGYEADVE